MSEKIETKIDPVENMAQVYYSEFHIPSDEAQNFQRGEDGQWRIPEATNPNEKSGIMERIRNRFTSIKESYSHLNEKQKDVILLGAMAVAPVVLPVIEKVSGRENEVNDAFLQGYGLIGLSAMMAIGTKQFRKNNHPR